MPLYEYQCEDCRRPFEELVLSPSKAAEVHCPACGGQNVKKQVSLFAARVVGRAFGAASPGAAPASSCSTST